MICSIMNVPDLHADLQMICNPESWVPPRAAEPQSRMERCSVQLMICMQSCSSQLKTFDPRPSTIGPGCSDRKLVQEYDQDQKVAKDRLTSFQIGPCRIFVPGNWLPVLRGLRGGARERLSTGRLGHNLDFQLRTTFFSQHQGTVDFR